MKALEFLIDKDGAFVYPEDISEANTDGVVNPPTGNQITCIYYDSIVTNANGTITPTDPVTTGLSGTITLQARSTDDSAWSDIQDGVLDLSTGGNMAFPSGVIRSINAVCADITGCNYILIRLDRGA